MTTNITRATPEDAGCWIDGWLGQYASAHMLQLAVDHGYPADERALHAALQHLASMGVSATPEPSADDLDRVEDAADAAERWMNEHVAPDGLAFGWHDGEFFLQDEEWWSE